MSIHIVNGFEGKDYDLVFQYLEEHEPQEVADLLTLLCCLGGVDIPVRMLLRADDPRMVWGTDGEKEELFEHHLRIGSLVNALSSGSSLESLISYGLVEKKEIGCRKETGSRNETLSVDPSFLKSAQKLMACRLFWNKQAMILACHTFPRGRDLGVSCGIVGNQQLHVLKYVMKYFLDRNKEGNLSLYIKHLMAETLLAASTFSDFGWKYTAITIAEEIMLTDPNPYLMSWASIRRSTLHRLDPLSKGSNVEESTPGYSHEPRSNALLMRHSLQSAQAAAEIDMFTDALSILECIKPLDSTHPSTMERIVLRDRDFAIGRIYRFRGRFEEALKCFKLLLPSYFEVNKSYYSFLSHLSNTFIELGDASQAEKILLDVSSEYDIHDKYFQISLAEAKLHLKSFKEAEEICEELWLSHDALKRPDKNALIFNLRTLTILARAAHLDGRLDEALRIWESCLEELRKLEEIGWTTDGFMQMICSFSIADLKQKMGDLVESRRLKTRAETILEAKGRAHWIVGLGTVWLDAIRTSIEATGTELALRIPERWWMAQIEEF